MKCYLEDIIHYATLAPSGHNTQPWLFTMKDNSILIYPDYARRLGVVDPDDHALFISLGCALENLIIAANHMGHGVRVEYFPPNEKRECIRATITEDTIAVDADLFSAIPNRQSTRCRYDGRPIPPKDMEELKRASAQDRVSLMLFTDQEEIDPIIAFVKEANVRQFRNKAFVNELVEWIRFTKKDALARRDGLNSASMGLPFIPTWFGKFILSTLATPNSEAKKSERLIRGSSGLALFVAEFNDKPSWIDVGRSFERFALKATALSIKHAHMNMPCEEVEVRSKLQGHLGLKTKHPLLLLRIGYSNPRPESYRRSVDDVLI